MHKITRTHYYHLSDNKKRDNKKSKRAKYYKILQNTTKYCKILQNTTKYYKILQNTAKYYKILQNNIKKHKKGIMKRAKRAK